MRSIVYLIGAGPGDPGLITVRGLQCLAAADVVLYDHLVHPRLLGYARADAEQIDVGAAAPQPLEEEAICYLLAEKAREGKIVARLKWGDPFVFESRRIRGALSARARRPLRGGAGHPRGYCGAELCRGPGHVSWRGRHADLRPRPRRRRKTPASVDWASLARLDGTIVCYGRSARAGRTF